jgi:PII-like signaling protein
MRVRVPAQVLTVYIGEQDQWHGGPLYAALVDRFREVGVAGVTVLHGALGYGGHRAVHAQRLQALYQKLPMVLEVVDIPERIQAALAVVDEMVAEGLATLTDVAAIRLAKDPKA